MGHLPIPKRFPQAITWLLHAGYCHLATTCATWIASSVTTTVLARVRGKGTIGRDCLLGLGKKTVPLLISLIGTPLDSVVTHS